MSRKRETFSLAELVEITFPGAVGKNGEAPVHGSIDPLKTVCGHRIRQVHIRTAFTGIGPNTCETCKRVIESRGR